MSINFLQQFADISIENTVIAPDLSKLTIDDKKQNDDKKQKAKKDVKQKKFVHASGVIMVRGQYKGYGGFVYDYFPSKVNIAVDEQHYVFSSVYGERSVGDIIDTQFGPSMILTKIDSLCNVLVSEKDENGEDRSFEIRLPRCWFVRMVVFVDDGIMKIAQLLNVSVTDGNNEVYDMVVMNMDYTKSYNKEDLIRMYSDLLVSGVDNNYGERIKKFRFGCSDEYYVVCQRPNLSDMPNYFGKYGKLICEIPEQYFVSSKRVISVDESHSTIKGYRVKVDRGLYKNRNGELVNIDKAYMNVNIDAVSKKLTNHLVRLENGSYEVRKIVAEDVFYVDLRLKNGNYFQVNECYGDLYIGIEKDGYNMVDSQISVEDISEFMPGFAFKDREVTLKSDVDTMDRKYMFENVDVVECEVDDQDVEETDDVSYGMEEDVVEDVRDQFENTEGEMKQTFKDVERSSVFDSKLTKTECEYLKMIDKCSSVVGDVSNKYDVLSKVGDAVSLIKKELERISIQDWKVSDTKYIVICLVCYDLMKTGHTITIYQFRNFITRLFNAGFITQNSIVDSAFIRCEDNLPDDSCWKSISMSMDDRLYYKSSYKSKKYLDLVKDIAKRCHVVLGCLFGPMAFWKANLKEEMIAVSKQKKIMKEYPKYFLTTNDIVNNVRDEDAKRIMWGPESKKLIDLWKSKLDGRLVGEKNEKVKNIYGFVKDNLENAPFVLDNLSKSSDDMDQLRYKELKRAFETFSAKLRVYVDKKIKNKKNYIDSVIKRREDFNIQRVELSNNKNRN